MSTIHYIDINGNHRKITDPSLDELELRTWVQEQIDACKKSQIRRAKYRANKLAKAKSKETQT